MENSYSESCESQNQSILKFLQSGKGLTELEMLELYNCNSGAQRIHDLRSGRFDKTKHSIYTEIVHSNKKHFARYWLSEFWEIEKTRREKNKKVIEETFTEFVTPDKSKIENKIKENYKDEFKEKNIFVNFNIDTEIEESLNNFKPGIIGKIIE